MMSRFFIYGFIGWFFEIFWTALGSLWNRDYRLMGKTSVWMFFIYGSVVFFEPVCAGMEGLPIALRGLVYVLLIFVTEYAAGSALRKASVCPWDYSGARFAVNGLIRLDYAPVWFLVGLMYERVYFLLR